MTTALLRSSIAGACLLAASAASAQVLFTSGGFEGPSYAAGALFGQNGWTQDGFAPWEVGASGVGGSQGVRVTGGETDWAYVPISFTPSPGAELFSVKVDIARTLGGTTPSFGYAIDVYDSNVERIGRAGLLNSSGVIRPFVTSLWDGFDFNPGGVESNISFGSAVASGTFVTFELVFDFSVKEFEVVVNGTSFGSVPFVTVGSVDVADADLQVSSGAGALDEGFFDNLVISAVPEPSTWAAIVGALALGVTVVVRRRTS